LFREITKHYSHDWQKLIVYYAGTLATVAVMAPITEWRKGAVAYRLKAAASWLGERRSDADRRTPRQDIPDVRPAA